MMTTLRQLIHDWDHGRLTEMDVIQGVRRVCAEVASYSVELDPNVVVEALFK
tara:strand:+ start:172 stop:327 length:156 start_codon:yes stop_codon:yes gene_type:complete